MVSPLLRVVPTDDAVGVAEERPAAVEADGSILPDAVGSVPVYGVPPGAYVGVPTSSDDDAVAGANVCWVVPHESGGRVEAQGSGEGAVVCARRVCTS